MKYLGLDWGKKTIGLAFSEGNIASPFGTLNVQQNGLCKIVAKIAVIAKGKGIDNLVLGKPEGEMGKIVEKAAAALGKSGLKVSLADETLSTREAKSIMLEMGIKQKARRDDNAMAAAIILQRFLDEDEDMDKMDKG